LISVEFLGVGHITWRELITGGPLKLSKAWRVRLKVLVFSKRRRHIRGFAIDFSYDPVAFHLALIVLADKASLLAF